MTPRLTKIATNSATDGDDTLWCESCGRSGTDTDLLQDIDGFAYYLCQDSYACYEHTLQVREGWVTG